MATSEGIPSSIDIEFLELNDNPYNKVVPHVAQPSFIVPPIPHETPNRHYILILVCVCFEQGAMAGV